MQIKINSILYYCFAIAILAMIFPISSCAKGERPASSCEYLVKIMNDKEKRQRIESWLEDIAANPSSWREADGKTYRGMGAYHISISDTSRLKELELPEHTQLLASKDVDGNVRWVTAAIAQGIGVVFSEDSRFIDDSTVSNGQWGRVGVECWRKN